MNECEYCGQAGCHWTRHAEARADVAAWQREFRQRDAELSAITCGAVHAETGARCHLMPDHPGPRHYAFTHYPGQLVTWPNVSPTDDTIHAERVTPQ